MADKDIYEAEMFWAMMQGSLQKAETEVLRRVTEGSLSLPSSPTNALRLLMEYFAAAPHDFKPLRVNTDGYAQMLHMLAFDPMMAPSPAWPYSQVQMHEEFLKAGLTGDHLEAVPMSYVAATILIGPEKYRQTLVTLLPSLDDMRLTEAAQVRVSTVIEQSSGATSASVSMHMLPGKTLPISARVSPEKRELPINPVVKQTDDNTKTRSSTSTTPQTRFEEEYTVLYDGSILRTSSRKKEEAVVVEREVQLQKPYVQNKSLEERTAGDLFLAAYNKVNGTDYIIRNSPDDTDRDLIAGPSKGNPLLNIQVIKCSDGRVWSALAARSQYIDTLDERQAVSEVMTAIHKKARHYGSKNNLILLLDGGWSGFTSDVIHVVLRERQADLQNTGFAEIWYVSRVSGNAARLYP